MRHWTDPQHFTLNDLLSDAPPDDAAPHAAARGCLVGTVLSCLVWACVLLTAAWLTGALCAVAAGVVPRPW